MLPIQPPIQPGDTRPQVANLYAALQFLIEKSVEFASLASPELRDQLRSEQPSGYFKGAAVTLVKLFQAQFGLDGSLGGVVEDQTADLLNQQLKKYGAFDDGYRVYGMVRDRTSQAPKPGVRVRAFDRDVAHSSLLGESFSDADGAYLIRFDAQAFRLTAAERGGPELFVQVLDEAGRIMGQSRQVNNAGTATQLDVEMGNWIVRGRVTNLQGLGVLGLRVRAFDRDLRFESPLGDEAVTDRAGRYMIVYTPTQFDEAEALPAAPDLIVRVYRGSSGDTDLTSVLAESPIRFNAQPLETVDLMVPVQGLSEFERVSQTIEPLLTRQGRKAVHYPHTHLPQPDAQPQRRQLLAEELTDEDIPFIVGDTGLDAENVQAWIHGARLRREALDRLGTAGDLGLEFIKPMTAHGWPFFYALLISRGTIYLPGIVRLPRRTWATIQSEAESLGRIQSISTNDRDILFDALELIGKLLRIDPRFTMDSILSKAFRLAPLPNDLALQALAHLDEKGDIDPDEFFSLAERQPGDEAALQGFVRALRLHDLTSGDEALMARLNLNIDGQGSSLEPLAGWSSTMWLDTVTEAWSSDQGKPESEKAWEKATDLQWQMERKHPATALLARIGDAPKTYESIGLNQLHGLPANHRKLVDRVLTSPGGASQAVTAFTLEVVNILENLRRFGSTGMPFDAAANLMNKGLETPMKVLNTPPSVLRDMLDKIYPPGKVDDYVYFLNQHIQSGVAIISNGQLDINAGRFFGFGGNAAPAPEVLENAPTLRGLFGDLDECICRPCESVLGLPAYLVDLLELLKKIAYVPSGAQPSSALDLLRERRPEIFELPLNCVNAEQEVLHIDLAIEVMQEAVRNLASSNAMSALTSLAYPWNLPFNRDWLALEMYLSKLGSSRAEILALQGASISSNELSAATLGIYGNTEWQLITTPTGANSTPRTVWENYGLRVSNGTTSIIDPSSGKQRTGSPGDVLKWLSVLLERTGLSLTQLNNLIQSRFIWPPSGTGLYVQYLDINHPCKLSEMYLSGKEDFLFDRLHRLVRLWRKLPNWSLPILDSAIVAFNPGPLSSANPPSLGQDQLCGIAAVRRVEQTLNMRPESILALLLPLKDVRVQADETTYRTLYADIFQSERVSEAGRSAFSNAPATPPASGGTPLTRWAADIAAAIGVSSQEVTKHSTVVSAGTLLSVESLTWFYRHASLSRALNLSISETLRLIKLTGVDPLATATTSTERITRVEQLLTLGESAKLLAGQPISLGLLIWLLNPGPDAADTADMPVLNQKNETHIRSELVELRDALNAIEGPEVTPENEQELRDSIQVLLHESFGFSFAPDDFAVLFKLISNLAANGVLDTDQLRIKTQLSSNLLRSPDDNLKPLFSMAELDDLFTQGKPDTEIKRLQALLERLWERGTWVLAIEQQLANLIGNEKASVIVHGIGAENHADRNRAIQVLSGGISSLPFGLAQPIANNQEGENWTQTVTWPNSRIPQFRAILQRLTQRRREAKLLETVLVWLNGTADEATSPTYWDESAAFSLLSDNLTMTPATNNSAGILARDRLLSPTFLNSNTVSSELVLWTRRLNGLAVLANQLGQSGAGGAALISKLNLDWQAYILPSTTDARRKLPALLWLAQAENLGSMVLGAVFDQAATTESAQNALATRLGISGTELLPLFNQANGLPGSTQTVLGQLRDPMQLLKLHHLAVLARQFKTGHQVLQVLAGTNETDAAATARSLLATKLESFWTETEQQIGNQLRKHHRDALVGGLLHLHQNKIEHAHWQTADDLYQYYLIDPQVQPCLRTTRILQATAAIQLLMQRILFGIEPAIKLSGADADDIRRRWDWMSSYRVWEANRKVYLYPENWLFPELRDDKSSSFKQLEAALGQGELNGESANQAFIQFLDDVGQMGQIQVISMFEDIEWDQNTPPQRKRRDLYVIGRSQNPPYQFYWRKAINFGYAWMEWAPWQRIELDTGTNLISPMVIDSQLTLVWIEAVDNKREANRTDCELNVRWARLSGTAWKRVEVTSKGLILKAPQGFSSKDGYVPRCRKNPLSKNPEILIYRADRIGVLTTLPPDVQHEAEGSDKNYAIQRISWKVWLKTKDEYGGTLFVDVSSSFTCLIGNDKREFGGNFNYTEQGKPIQPSPPPYVRLRSAQTLLSSKPGLPGVLVGKQMFIDLHFEIDGEQKGLTLDSLGLSMPNVQYTHVASFELSSNNLGEIKAPAISSPNLHLDYAESFGLGYRELNSNGTPANPFSIYRQSGNVTRVFQNTSEKKFFALGAWPQKNFSNFDASSIWYFQEGDASSYIDLEPPGAQLSKFGIYVDTYREAGSYSKVWSENQIAGLNQFGTFSAELLPSPDSNLVIPETWPSNSDFKKLFFFQGEPYSCYNWETFFHAPLLIADQLTKQQKFEDAERWLSYIFDPSSGEPGTSADRFLKFQVFKDLDPNNNVARELTILARAANSSANSVELEIIRHMIDRWREQPFRPFAIARRRQIAFLWRTLFAYLDNLIAWADSLYRRDTREAVQEAVLLYVLAARILGRRPAMHQGQSANSAKTYDDIQASVDEFGNFWIDAGATGQKNYFHPSLSVGNSPNSSDSSASLGILLFCIPHNDKLDQYWNTVDQRLFNIRHCRNIEGIERILPLTEPPIDPELLVRATAAGLSIADALSFRYAPAPHHRFAVLASRAAELTGETRSLGSALLAAIEKRDAEKLSLLRADHELNLLQSIKELRQLQIEESERNVDALLASRHSVEARYRQYQRLLGKQEIRVPMEGEFGLEESMLGRAGSALSDQSSSWGLLVEESKQLEELRIARFFTDADSVARLVAWGFNVSASLASITAIADPSPSKTAKKVAKAFSSLGTAASSTADGFRAIAQFHQNEAAQQATNAGHIRRRDEWAFQSNQTLKELQQIDKQLIANRIRIEIARKELANQGLQIKQSQAIHDYLRSKYSNTELYQWMVTELSSLHDQAYRMALELARQAERAAGRELGLSEGKPNVIGNAYWDGRRNGLLAGERLHQSIKRLEVYYLNENRREFELTKHISLRRLAPGALLSLITSGSCEVSLPEWLFDQDAPGHYQRRIKTMSLSIPCVVGPYANVTIKATLLSSEVRVQNTLSPTSGYQRDTTIDDARFEVSYGATESICTSSGRDDSGLFETNLRDDRYLPFEYAGAISTWRLEWPSGSPNFDPATLSDVIFQLRYTAREGRNSLRDAATRNLKSIWSTDNPSSLYLLVDVKREFASEWARLSEQGTQGINIEIKIDDSFFPYSMANRDRKMTKMACWTKQKSPGSLWNDPVELPLPDPRIGKVWSIGVTLPEPANSLDEAWLLIAYSILNADQNI